MKTLKGQVSTEYLVILAVVLVVALVVVALVGGTTPISGSVTETQSRNYWGAQSPMSITDWKYAGTALSLRVVNRDASMVTVTAINAGGSAVYSTSTTFNPGEEKTIGATAGSSCGGPGAGFTLDNVSVIYTRSGITGNLEQGGKPIIGKCS